MLVSIGTVAAQSVEAETLFNDGNTLMKQGKFAEACDAYEASNKIEPRAGTLIRLGACREKNHQLASAWSAYKDALTRVKDPSKKQIAKEKVADLEAKLSVLTVSVSDDHRVEGLTLTRNGKPIDPVLWNRVIPVNGGVYVIAASAPGREDWQTTVTIAIASAKISVEIPKLSERRKAAAPAVSRTSPKSERDDPANSQQPGSSTPDKEDEDGEAPAAQTWTTKRKLAVGFGGVAALAAITGFVVGSQVKTKQNSALMLCPDPQTPCVEAQRANALIQSARTRAIVADGALVLAGASAIAAGVLWFTGAPSTSSQRVAVVPSVAPGTAMLALTGSF